jgi:hypothetical protein
MNIDSIKQQQQTKDFIAKSKRKNREQLKKVSGNRTGSDKLLPVTNV